ncbi:MAG: EFR1 family ferrodoxin [Chitinivibrionales bacterium]|nr:EFR1 family ferrodoxin [Chitinivibrionales bacterium]
MSIALVYFSGTGNTEVVAELLTHNLAMDDSVVVFKIEDILKKKVSLDLASFDMLGIGFPIHGFDAPQIVYDLVRLLPPVQKKRTFIFSTCAGPFYLNDTASFYIVKQLVKKGYRVFYDRQFYLPPNIMIPYNDEVAKQLYAVAVEKTKIMAEEIEVRRNRVVTKRIFPVLFRWLFVLSKLSWFLIPLNLTVTKACVRCIRCVKVCPRDAIALKNKRIHFGFSCIGCMRCVYTCPYHAITGRMNRFFILKDGYNLRRVIADQRIKGTFITKTTIGKYKSLVDYIYKKETLV